MKRLSYIGFFLTALLLIGQGCLSLGGGNAPATSGPAGMFVSTDKGETWQSISKLPTIEGVRDLSGVSVYRLFTDPQDPAALYWASRGNGFFYTYDEGRTWQQSKGELASGFIYGIAIDPRDRCTLFVTNGPQIFRSEDCSRSWKEVYRESRPNVRVSSLTFNALRPLQLLALQNNGDLIETVDDGKSWSIKHRFQKETVDIFTDPNQRDVFYVATRNQSLYRSIDAGASWESLSENMKAYPGANDYRRFFMHPTSPGVLYWVSTFGILRSHNGGDTWEKIELITPPGSVQIYGFGVNPKNEKELYYTATINARSTFYRSFDGGTQWSTKKLPSGQNPTVLHVHPEKENIVYVGFTIPPKQ